MVFNATFINISVISWRSVLLVEETGGPGENHQSATSHWQTLSHNVVYIALSGIQTHISNALSLPQKSMVPLTYATYNPCSLNQLISWHILLLLSIPNSMVLLTYVTFHYCPLPQPQNQWFSWHMLPTINVHQVFWSWWRRALMVGLGHF
jgi:hypothetical protein